MSASLFVIEQSLVDLEELRTTLLDEGDTEAVAVVDQQIAEWQDRSPAKVASSLAFVRQQENTVAACKVEEERIRAIRKRAESNIDRYKAYVLAVMQRFDIKELKAEKIGGFRRQLAGGVQSLEISDPLLVPEGLREYTIKMPGDALIWLEKFLEYSEAPKHPLVTQAVNAAVGVPDNKRIREAIKEGAKSSAFRLLPRGEIVKVI